MVEEEKEEEWKVHVTIHNLTSYRIQFTVPSDEKCVD